MLYIGVLFIDWDMCDYVKVVFKFSNPIFFKISGYL